MLRTTCRGSVALSTYLLTYLLTAMNGGVDSVGSDCMFSFCSCSAVCQQFIFCKR